MDTTKQPYIRITRLVGTSALPRKILESLIDCEVPEMQDVDPNEGEEFRLFDGSPARHGNFYVVRADHLEAWLNENGHREDGDAFKRIIDDLTESGKVKLPVMLGIHAQYCEQFSR